MSLSPLERYFLTVPRGLASRIRVFFYRRLGLKAGRRNRLEAVRCRRLVNIILGDYNSFTEGCWLWPLDVDYQGIRIRVGSNNYFNRNVMVDACGYVEIGDNNMIGPDVYITDSNHSIGPGISPKESPMQAGRIRIGNNCWLGAKVVLLKDVELGDGCVVAAGSVVTRSFPSNSVIGGIPARLIRTVLSW
jgi:maltose O-acetyltransferase